MGLPHPFSLLPSRYFLGFFLYVLLPFIFFCLAPSEPVTLIASQTFYLNHKEDDIQLEVHLQVLSSAVEVILAMEKRVSTQRKRKFYYQWRGH